MPVSSGMLTDSAHIALDVGVCVCFQYRSRVVCRAVFIVVVGVRFQCCSRVVCLVFVVVVGYVGRTRVGSLLVAVVDIVVVNVVVVGAVVVVARCD